MKTEVGAKVGKKMGQGLSLAGNRDENEKRVYL